MFSETFELRALAMRVASNQLYPITSGNRKDSAQAVLPIGNLGITNYLRSMVRGVRRQGESRVSRYGEHSTA